ncbi:ribokinase [Monocercomonoides exilis]|uniref:ribokinase n=1 Tax=Monocercomonoides exilis TaxID=2049356 RepID=UPI0035597927|nr:ribokinase [Monocercomonoides exilis]|eukprot:MONOS_4856.1-p1 / transcript=MONOS_4856.1 / gene=MONOS_4856 / organism=Monocercomonoides_exilis_PA203 / gene_product=ribokinase / transcript_product=ribokinase / location=Mono_scaffold00135:66481-68078(+) / protein_length=397 / sequence_SO=supercontig / SO=protein_coding / is_pseudo=false
MSEEKSVQKYPDIVVVGASNMDLIANVPRLPLIGETLHGSSFSTGFGGKGANQAAAAAKLGAKSMFIGKVGEDFFGKGMIENLKSLDIDTTYFQSTSKASSGVAPIFVDEDGRNAIVIVNGANDLITREDILSAEHIIAHSKIMIVQLEIPIEISQFALEIAEKHGLVTILNPAPVPAGNATCTPECKVESPIPFGLINATSIVVPNEIEALAMCGFNTTKEITIKGEAKENEVSVAELHSKLHLLSKEASSASSSSKPASTGKPFLKMSLVTLGSMGASFALGDEESGGCSQPIYVSCPKVEKVVDTSGAGDCFIGAFAYFLSTILNQNHKDGETYYQTFCQLLKNPSLLSLCVQGGVIISTNSVTHPGTQKSYPTAEVVKSLSLLPPPLLELLK